jgi:hypothetical protein
LEFDGNLLVANGDKHYSLWGRRFAETRGGLTIIQPTLKVSNNQPFMFVAFSDGICFHHSPGDSRRAIMLVAVGDRKTNFQGL